MTRGLLPLLLLLATAAEARPLKGFCDSMEPLRKLADLKYVKPIVQVRPLKEGAKPEDIVFTIAAKSGPIRIVPAADGTIAFPLTDALCAENPDLTSNHEGNVEMSISVDPQIPPARELDYRQLDALRREWDEAISRQNLVYRMLAPSAKGYHLTFEPGKPATAEIRLPQGPRRLSADAQGNLYIPIEPAWAAANPAIVLSEMPTRIGLRFKG